MVNSSHNDANPETASCGGGGKSDLDVGHRVK